MRLRHHMVSVAALVLLAIPAAAQMQIKVNDTTFIKFGLLMQTQADETEDPAAGRYAQNIFIRRARFLIGGQIAPNVTFFAETDAPNIGKSLSTGTKNSQPSVFVQDAYVEYKVNDAFALDAGLLLISPSRNGLQSAASLLPIDYGPYTFANSAPTQSAVGRDTGVQAKGYLLGKKLEYRAGVFQGARDLPNRSFRTTARVQYNFLDPEVGFFYTGTYLGKKKVFSVGGGIDHQNGYDGYAADVFFDHPLGPGALTAQGDYIHYNGDTFLKTLPEQNDILAEAGYLIGKTKFMPVVQFSQRNFAGTTADEKRYTAGLNYFISGHNANVKIGFTRIDVEGAPSADQATVQFQLFYF